MREITILEIEKRGGDRDRAAAAILATVVVVDGEGTSSSRV